ncbi:GH12 family glycosyl hydrolase domain-containing protein [Actinacidiphila soli]|uniref:GH12 family glycosyl hydrolase domain-containing protein n=1 Tax=Actinacidiphila soli TaxID=2487275 RepID=UPI000FCAC739|nr:ricin-type beta-trefoil lectin domain protein [Actinacidiphila soli]
MCTSTRQPFPQRLVETGKFSIEPNAWNTSAGSLCLDTPGSTGFTVSAVRGLVAKNPKAPDAYPNIATVPGTSGLPVRVGDLGDATSDWSAWAAASGSYNMAYDLWYGPSAGNCDSASSAEVMIWLDATDDIAPAGSRIPGTVTLGDASYAVFAAPITGAHSVISYVRAEPTHTARRLDLRLFTADALQRGYVPPESYLCKVAAGFEIWNGGVGLRTFSFAFHNSVGLPVGVLRSGAAGICLRADGRPATGSCGGAGGKTTWTVANDGSLRTGGRCLQPAKKSGSVTTAVLAACTGGTPQRWATDPGHRLVNTASGRCLDTAGGSLAVGVTAQLKPCHNGASQRWQLPYNGLAS